MVYHRDLQRMGAQLAKIVAHMSKVDDEIQDFMNLWNPYPSTVKSLGHAQQLLDDAAESVAEAFKKIEKEEQ